MYKMIAFVMMQNYFEPGFGLGRNTQGIIEPILGLVKGARYGLWYIPIDDDLKTKKKMIKHWLSQSQICIHPSKSRSMPSMKTLGKESVTSSRRSMLLLRKRSS